MSETRYGSGQERDLDDIVTDMAKGAIAGAIGVWVMDRVDWFMYDRQDPNVRRQTQEARPGGLDPAHVAANQIAGAIGIALSPPQPHPSGVAIHYSLGIGPGAAYGALRDRVPGVGAGRGLLWGSGLFALQDELFNSVTGSSGNPESYPWQAHGRGLVAHLVYGFVTDLAFSAMKGGSVKARQRDVSEGSARALPSNDPSQQKRMAKPATPKHDRAAPKRHGP